MKMTATGGYEMSENGKFNCQLYLCQIGRGVTIILSTSHLRGSKYVSQKSQASVKT